MRCPILCPIAVLTLQAAPPAPLHIATSQVLEAFDTGSAELPHPAVKPADRPALAWLRGALESETPTNPFPKGTPSHREAQALLKALAMTDATSVANLRCTQAGSQVLLWKWGQQHTRQARWDTARRQMWEDRLLRPDIHPILRGWALRHALCFALALADEARLTDLRTLYGEDLPGFFQTFQRAFGLLGGPAPRFDLWTLPELAPVDLALSELGSAVWIAPLDLPPPAGSAWIIPASASDLPTYASRLDGDSLKEAVQAADQLRASFRTGHFAPSRAPWEERALAYFPIEIRFDEAKRVKRIRMGDAAQARPTP